MLDNADKQPNTMAEETQKSTLKEQKLPTFLEKLKGQKRDNNEYFVRANFSFTPKTGSNGELKRIAIELLEIACWVDEKAMLSVWEERKSAVDLGSINMKDLMNPNTYFHEISQYINKPKYVNLQPGNTAYKMGVRFSVTMDKHQFLRRWNAMKQTLKEEKRNFYSLSLAPMQNSANAYLIGIAAGSSEDQDVELLNKKLADTTGITGIKTSFQNINQQGITNDFWKIANEKAVATGSF